MSICQKYSRSFFFSIFTMVCSAVVFGQAVVSNNGVVISIPSGVTVSVSSVSNATGAIANNGVLTTSGTIENAGTIEGNGTYNVGGDWTNNGTFTAGTSTVNFTGTAKNINGTQNTTFYNLTFKNTSSLSTSKTVNVNNTLTVESGANITFGNNNPALNVTGNTLISGTVTCLGAGKTFSGDLTINAGGSWTEQASPAYIVGGNFTNNGSFTAGGGTYTLSGVGKTIGGTNAISLASVTLTGSYTNTGVLTVLNNINNVGTLTQGTSAILNLGGSFSTNTTLNASASGNTVNYTSLTGSSTIKSATYHHLTLSNSSGTNTAGGNITVNGTLTTTAGGTLDMSTYILDGTMSSVSHAGTLKTAATGATPIPASKTWGGTVQFYANAAQTIPSGTFQNLTITDTDGSNNYQKTAGQNVVVNGVLNLDAGNFSAALGALDIPSGYLDLGISATITGSGNITGTVRRSHLFTQNGTNLLAFTGANQGLVLFDLPDQTSNPLTFYIKASTGTPISTTGCSMTDTPNPVARYYTIWREGANWGNAKSSFRHYYLESEIPNGVNESALSVWKKTSDASGCLTIQELGKSNQNTDLNFVGIARQPVTSFISTTEGYTQIFSAPTAVSTLEWNGSISTTMTNAENWTPQGSPAASIALVIPHDVAFNFNPVLPDNATLECRSMLIETGKILSAGNNSTLKLAGANQVFVKESGATFNQGNSTILIESGVESSIAGALTVHNITVASGTQLLIPGEASITIEGTFTNNGTIIASNTPNNTLTFSGTGQTIPNTSGSEANYNNLVISGTNTILPSTLNVYGNLTYSGSGLNAGTSVVTMKGNTSQTIGGSSSLFLANLTIQNTHPSNPVVNLNTALTITNTLAFSSGKIVTGANTLTMGAGGTITGYSSSSFVEGKLARIITGTGTTIYPVGKGNDYRPAEFTYTASPGNKTVEIEHFLDSSPLSLSTASTGRYGSSYWNIIQSSTGTPYTIGLHNNNVTPSGSTVLLRREGTGTAMQVATTYNNPYYTNATAFSTSSTSNDVMLAETAIPLTISGATASNKVYDGTNTATLAGGSLIGVVSPDVVTLIQTGTFADKHVGTGKAVTANFSLSGANAGAYTLTQPEGITASITAYPLTITGAATSKTYDGTTSSATSPTITSGELQGSDMAAFTQTYNNKNVGAGKTITPSGGVTDGNNGNNYTYTFVNSTNGVITAKTITVVGATTSNKEYDATTMAIVSGGILSGVESGDNVTLLQQGTFASKNVGTNITITAACSINGADVANYLLTQPTLVSRDITARPITVTAATDNKIYDGGVSSAGIPSITAGALQGSDAAAFTQAFTDKNVGVNKEIIPEGVVLDGNNGNNYNYSFINNSTGTITAKELSVTEPSIDSKTYDGQTTTGTITPGTLSGLVGTETVTASATGVYADAAVGTGKTATVTYTLQNGTNGGLAANYSLAVGSGMGDITAKALTITGLTGNHKVYDGTTAATANGTPVASGIISPDDVSVSGMGSFTFASSNVANGISITTTGYALSGADADNYTLTQPTLNANITPKELTITGLTGNHKVYDRTNTATASGTPVLAGKVGSDDVTLSGTAVYSFASVNVANGISISTTGYTLSGSTAGNYSLTQPVLSADITAKELTISGLTGSNKVYDGTTTATAAGTPSLNGVINPDAVTLGGTAAYSFASATVGDSKTITTSGYSISGAQAGNYSLTQPTLSANITAMALTIGGVTANNKVYDGNTSATLSGTPVYMGLQNGETYSVGGTPTASFDTKNVGSPKTVTVTGYTVPNSNYTLTQLTLTANITRRAITITSTADSKAYDGNTSSGANPTITSGSLASGDVGTYSQTFDTKNTGTDKTLTPAIATLVDGTDADMSANYDVTLEANNAGTITPKALSITSPTIAPKEYDGLTSTGTITPGTISGLIGSETLTATATGEYTSASIGTNKSATVTYNLQNGSNGGLAANYSLAVGSGTGDITTKTLTITGLTGDNKVYDGTTTASATGTPALDGVISPDVVTVNGTGSYAFASPNVANGISITTTGYTLSGANAANYSLTQPTLTANITARNLTITGISAVNKVYDGNTTATLSGSPAYTGLQNGEMFTVTGTPSATFDTKNIGTNKSVSVSGYTAPSANYTVTQPTGLTANITAKALTVTNITANNKVYDGTTTATLTTTSYVLNGIVSSESVTLDATAYTASFTTEIVGTNKDVTVSGLALSGADAANYTLTQPTGLKAGITGKSITVSGISADNKVYDGNTTATLTTTNYAFSGIESGDVVTLDASSYTATFSNKNTGTEKAVTVIDLALSGADAANYTLTQPTGLTADITAKALIVSGISANNKVYNATTTATLTTTAYVLNGIVGSETVTLNTASYTANYNNKNVGTGKAVTVSGLALSGINAGNYTLTQPTDLTGEITAKELTVSGLTGNNKEYDGTTTASASGTPALQGVIGSEDVTLSGTGTFAFVSANAGTGIDISTTGYSITGNDIGNYVLTQPTLSANITARSLTITGISAANKVYDGNTAASLSGSPEYVGLQNEETFTVTGTASASFDTKNIGTGKVVTVSGYDAPSANYTVTQPTLSANITAKALTVTNITANNKVYDGTTTATLTTTNYTLNGVVGNETVTLDAGNYTASFSTDVVGAGKAVTVNGLALSGGDAGNYTLTQPNGLTASITAKALMVVDISAKNKVYDGETRTYLITSTYSFTGVESGDVVTLDTTSYLANFINKNAGSSKSVIVSDLALNGADAGNYSLTQPASLTATITEKSVLPSISAANKIYDGTTSATITGYNVSNAIAGDVVNATGGTATFDTKDVGTGKTVTATGLTLTGDDAGNYILATASASTTASITVRNLIVSASAQSKTYGQTAPAMGTLNTNFTVTGLQVSDVVGAVSFTYSGSPAGNLAAATVGSYTITPSALTLSAGSTSNYNISYSEGTLTINAAELNVIASNQTKTYGQTAPTSGTLNTNFTVSGLQNSDAVSGVTLVYNGDPAGNLATASVGTYTIIPSAVTFSSGDIANYTLTYTPGTLTINTAIVTVTAANKTKTYGSTAPTSGVPVTHFTVSGLLNGDAASGVTLTYSGTTAGNLATASIGTYTITPSVLTLSSGSTGNYHITYATGTLTVDVANLVVTAINRSKTFGQTAPTSGTLNTHFSVLGLQNNDAANGVTLAYSGSPAGNLATASAGSYTITPSAITLSSGLVSNYSISYETAILTVNAAAITVTASAQSKSYGQTAPTSGTLNTNFTVTGLQGTDQASGVTLSYSGTPAGNLATASSGSYTITPSALVLSSGSTTNYTITYNTGTLTVNTAALTVTASAQSKTYGSAVTTVGELNSTFTVTGLQNTDAVSGATLGYSGSPAGNLETASAGSYTITPSAVVLSSGSASNYSVSYVTGTLTVNKAAITVTASDQSKAYGSTAPTSGTLGSNYNVLGLKNLDAVSGVTLSYSGSPAGNLATAAVGAYTITPSSLTFSIGAIANYTVTYNTGTLTVTGAVLTVTASNQSKTYGATVPTSGTLNTHFTVTGLLGSDAVNGATLSYSGSPAGNLSSASVGTYTITPSAITFSSGSGSNYSIVYNTGTLTVNAASLTVTASAQAKTYGATAPTTGTLNTNFTVSGVVGGDVVSGCTLSYSGSPAGNLGTATPGTYMIAPSVLTFTTGSASNYNITYTNGTLTVSTAALTISGISVANKSYDGTTNATISGTAVYSGLQNGESYAVVGTGTASFATAAVGNAKTVTVTGFSSPSSNYTLTQPSLTANITAVALTIKADNYYKQSGVAISPTTVSGSTDFTATGLVNDETVGSVTIDYGTGSLAGAAVGTYTNQVIPSAATGGTFTASNYSITYVSGDLIVGNLRYAVASTAWNLTSTWASTSGGTAGASVPVAGDFVFIGEAATGRAVTIPASYTANCATIFIGNGAAGTANSLTLTASTSVLNVTGNVTINRPSNGSLNVLKLTDGTATIDGDVILAGTAANNNRRARLEIVNGSVTVGGDIKFNAPAGVTENAANDHVNTILMNGGSGILNIKGSFTIPGTGGLYPGTSSTVNFNGNNSQTIPVGISFVTYNHLKINNTSATGATLGAAISATNVTGNITVGDINSGSILTTNNNSITLGNSKTLTIALNSAINAGTSSVTFGTSGTATINGTFTTADADGFSGSATSAILSTNNPTITLGSASTIEYNSASAQTITARNYANLTSSNSGARTLPSSGTIGISGTFTPGTNTYTITGSTIDFNGSGSQTIPAFNYNNLTSSSTGARTLPSSGTIGIAGTFTPGTNSYTIAGSTIDFNGNGSQTIPAFNYHNLTSSSTGARTLASSGTIGIAGTFTPGSNTYTTTGSTINYNSASSQTIAAFDYLNLSSSSTGNRSLPASGTIRVSGTFTPGSNTYSSGGGTFEYNGSGAQTIAAINYYNLTSSSTGSRTLASTGTIGIAGSFTPGTNAYTVTGSTIDFISGTPQTIPAFNYNNLTSSSSGTRTLASSGTIGVAGTFTPGSNTYTITGSTIDFNGSTSQAVPVFNYHNLTSSSSGARTLPSSGTIGVAATFTPGSNSYTTTGSTINYNGSSAQNVASFTYNHISFNGAGSKTLPVSMTLQGDWTNNATLIPGSGAVTFSGTSQSISGTSSSAFSTLNINSSTSLDLQSNASVSAALTASTPAISGSGTMSLNADASFTPGASGTMVSCPLDLGTAVRTLTVTDNVSAANDVTISSTISGNGGGITKAGASSRLLLSGNNTYTGAVTVSAGELSISSATALGTTAAGTTVSNGAALSLQGGISVGSESLSIAGTGPSGNASFDNISGDNTWAGPVTLAANATVRNQAGTLTLSNATAVSLGSNTLTLGGATTGGTGIISGAITGTGTISKVATGTWTLSGNNSYSGGTTLNNGQLNLNSTTAAGSGALTIAGASTIDNTSGAAITLSSNPAIALNADLTFGGSNALNLGTGTITMAANRTITTNGSTLTLGGALSAAAFTLTKSGSGALAFGSNAIALNSLTINAGSFTSTSGTLSIGGSLTNNGTFNHNNGTVDYIASGTQSISPLTYHHLTISGSGNNNKTATGNITVNGVLNLTAANASASQGALEMGAYTLFMGPSATTDGSGDVSGIITRNSISAQTDYTFGNKYTALYFTNSGTLPSSVSVKAILSNPSWKTNAINRHYSIIQTGGNASNKVNLRLSYKESELNGIVENSSIDFFDYHGNSILHDHGHNLESSSENWVEISNMSLTYIAPSSSDFTSKYWTLGQSVNPNFTWLGTASTDWTLKDNWSGDIPTSTSDVVIPDAATTDHDPTLPSATTIKSMSIATNGVLNGGSGTSLTIAGSLGPAWMNDNGIFNAGTSTVIFTGNNGTIGGSTDFYNVTIGSGALIQVIQNGDLNIAGTLTPTGILDVLTYNNSVDFIGSETQTVPSMAYHDIIFRGSGNKILGTPISLEGNWTNNCTGSVEAGSGTVTFNGSSVQTIEGTATTTFNNLTVNNSAGLTLGGIVGQSVTGTLTLTSGLITTGTNTLTLGASASISGASSSKYINGKLARVLNSTSRTNFPVGKGGNYRPLEFTYATSPGTNTVTVEHFTSSTPLSVSSASQARFGTSYWNIVQSAAGTEFSVGLHNNGSAPSGAAVILRREGSASTTQVATSFNDPYYTNTTAFSSGNTSSDVMLAETSIPLTVTGATTSNKVYDGTTTATVTGGALVGVVSGDEVDLIQAGNFATKNVGTDIVITANCSITGADAGAYSLTQPALTARDITKREITLTASADSRVYDATNTSSVMPVITTGSLASGDVATYIQTFDTKFAGSGKTLIPAVISIVDGSNANMAGNYNVTLANSTDGVITQKTLTVSGATTSNKVYDGNTTASVSGGTLVGVISGDEVTLTQAGDFSNASVGTNKAITASCSLAGADASNYSLTQPSLDARNITAAQLTVTASSQSKTYGSSVTTVGTLNTNFTVSGLITGEVANGATLSYSGTPAGNLAAASIGSYTITPSALTLSAGSLSNYNITYNTGTLTVNPAALTITANDKLKCFGANHTFVGTEFTSSGLQNTDAISSVTLASTAAVSEAAAGTYSIVPSAAVFSTGSADNYNISYVNGTLTVNPEIAAISCKTDDLCQLGAAEITIQVTGGTAPFTVNASGVYTAPHPNSGQAVSISNSSHTNVTTSTTFSGLPGNATYTFTVTDNNGCGPNN